MIDNASMLPNAVSSTTPNVARRKRANLKKPVINDWKSVASGSLAGAGGGAASGALFGSMLGPAGSAAGAVGGAIAGSVSGGIAGYAAPKIHRGLKKIVKKKKIPMPVQVSNELIANLRDFEECLKLVQNAWTDEARAAALEARRNKTRMKFQQEGNTYHEPYYHEQKAADYYRKGMQARRGGTFTKPNEAQAEEYDYLGHMHEQKSMDNDYNAREAFYHKQVELEQRDLASNPPGNFGGKATRAILRGTAGSVIGGLGGAAAGRVAGGIAGRVVGGTLGGTAMGLVGGTVGATLGLAAGGPLGAAAGGVAGAAVGRGVGRVVGRGIVSKLATKPAAQAAAKAGSATGTAASRFANRVFQVTPRGVAKVVTKTGQAAQKVGTAASAKAKSMARVAGASLATPGVVGRQVGGAIGQKTGSTIGAVGGSLAGSLAGGSLGYKSGWNAGKDVAATRYLDEADRARAAYEYHAMRARGGTLNSLLTAGPKLGLKIQKKLITASPGAKVIKKLKKRLTPDQATLDMAKQAAYQYGK